MTDADLARFIEARDHQRHRAGFPKQAEVTSKLEKVHAAHAHAPNGLSGVLPRMIGDMEAHMKKDELILVHAIDRGGDPGGGTPAAAMRAERVDHAREIAEIRRLTRDLTLPGNASRTWSVRHAGRESFTGGLAEHIRLKNAKLCPQFVPGARGGV